MKLAPYLRRIGFTGKPRADIDTLCTLHRLHLSSISYENIDVQLGRRCGIDIERSYRKLVDEHRGGWCYEMNGVFGWALREIGFDVRRVNGAVRRDERGDAAIGNHVVLLVQLDETWVADVGFGDGMFEPVPLRESAFEQRGFHYRLEGLDDGYWRLHNHEYGGAPSFDFTTNPADESLFRERCDFLQTSPASPFVMNLVCQRFVDGGYEIQLGRLAKHIGPGGVDIRLLDSAGELVERLRTTFDLDVPEVAVLWPRIVERHATLFGHTEQ